MRHLGALVIALALIATSPTVPLLAGSPPAPHMPANMAAYYLVLLRKGPNWSATPTADSKAMQEAHLANIRSLWKSGKMVVAGPIGDDGDLRGIFLFAVDSLDEAKRLTDTDPAVKAGRLVADVHPWWIEKRVLPEAGKYCGQSVEP